MHCSAPVLGNINNSRQEKKDNKERKESKESNRRNQNKTKQNRTRESEEWVTWCMYGVVRVPTLPPPLLPSLSPSIVPSLTASATSVNSVLKHRLTCEQQQRQWRWGQDKTGHEKRGEERGEDKSGGVGSHVTMWNKNQDSQYYISSSFTVCVKHVIQPVPFFDSLFLDLFFSILKYTKNTSI